jgi:hypothetical protein
VSLFATYMWCSLAKVEANCDKQYYLSQYKVLFRNSTLSHRHSVARSKPKRTSSLAGIVSTVLTARYRVQVLLAEVEAKIEQPESASQVYLHALCSFLTDQKHVMHDSTLSCRYLAEKSNEAKRTSFPHPLSSGHVFTPRTPTKRPQAALMRSDCRGSLLDRMMLAHCTWRAVADGARSLSSTWHPATQSTPGLRRASCSAVAADLVCTRGTRCCSLGGVLFSLLTVCV